MSSPRTDRHHHSKGDVPAGGDDRVWTLKDLLALHPWPAVAARVGGRRLEWLWHYDVPVAPDALWRVISDTSRVNRSLGVSEMRFEDRGAVRWGTSRAGGVRQEWIEVPWTWVAGQWLESVRLYERGFARVVYAVYHLRAIAGGTRLYVYFGAVPRGLLGTAALRFGFQSIGKGYETLLPRIAAEIERTRPAVLIAASPALSADAEARLAAIGRSLVEQGLDAAAVKELLAWISTGDEQDLYRIQVRERARAWRLDEDVLLRVCLHATRAGLLELSWDVVCPHCRGVTGQSSALGDLPGHGECEVCGIDFGTDTAEAVEITFHVHPSIREVPRRTFCSAEPATKEHIRVQQRIFAGGEVVVTPRLGPGRWRLRLHGEKRYSLLDIGTGGSGPAQEVVWRSSDAPRELVCGAAPPLRLVNDTSEDRTFIVEASQWADDALRPGKLLSSPEFRDLFTQEYLADGVQLAVGEQTILFTDVVGSTAMYVERGDPAAFIEVKRHFTEVFAQLQRHRGALVKTIGDAAMGAFFDPLDAVRAAQAIQRGFGPASNVRLRVSIHTGPCLAVKLNTDIDYFGNTVNLAAKLQSLAGAGEIVVSEATYAAPGVVAWLASEGAAVEEIRFEHKAFPAPVTARRWSPGEGSAEARRGESAA
jgi:class 3 adenylate cyclase